MNYPVRTIGELGALACGCKDAAEKVSGAVQAAGGLAHVARATIGALGAVWPWQVDAEVKRVDPKYDSMNADVGRCAGLSDSTKQDWAKKYQDWKAFAAPSFQPVVFDPSLLVLREGAALADAQARMATLQAFETDLNQWQGKLAAANCALSSPVEPAPPPPPPPLDVNSLVKWGVVGVVAVAAAYVIHKVL